MQTRKGPTALGLRGASLCHIGPAQSALCGSLIKKGAPKCHANFCTLYNAKNDLNYQCTAKDAKMTLQDIGQTIAHTRKRKKITQASLAASLGMSRATVSGIENGTVSEIGIRKVLSVCAALGLELVAQEKARRPTLQQLMKEQSDA
jgi:DNA-binding Xre family transcriptional regulator